MNPPRVFLICINRLVCEAVHVLLRREGIELLGMETDPDTALERVYALQPDIVLVEGDDTVPEGRLMPQLARLAYETADLRVIRLSLVGEQLCIYRREQRPLLNTQDLVAAIRAPQ